MAALQTLRNKPALLMGVIGGALLLFIITMVVENHNPFGPSDKAGKAFGQTIKITDLSLPSIAEIKLLATELAPIRNSSGVSHSLPRVCSTMV